MQGPDPAARRSVDPHPAGIVTMVHIRNMRLHGGQAGCRAKSHARVRAGRVRGRTGGKPPHAACRGGKDETTAAASVLPVAVQVETEVRAVDGIVRFRDPAGNRVKTRIREWREMVVADGMSYFVFTDAAGQGF